MDAADHKGPLKPSRNSVCAVVNDRFLTRIVLWTNPRNERTVPTGVGRWALAY
jgi:hypothetical protein